MDHASNALRASQLIGALMIRMVQFAEAGGVYQEFPDIGLIEAILKLCRNKKQSEKHLINILSSLTKILDDTRPGPQLEKLPARKRRCLP